MSIYIFPPSHRHTENFVLWENTFDKENVKKIIEIGDNLELIDGQVGSVKGSGVVEPFIRTSKLSWIPLEDKTNFIYNTLSYVCRKVNGDCFGFDLYGFVEHMQYTVYEGEKEGHYNWHLDSGNNDTSPRKLSMVLQLSDPEEYEGGQLEVFTQAEPTQIPKQKGLLCVFPSWTLHRVTPVTKGVRRSLVVWVSGPAFR